MHSPSLSFALGKVSAEALLSYLLACLPLFLSIQYSSASNLPTCILTIKLDDAIAIEVDAEHVLVGLLLFLVGVHVGVGGQF